MANPATIFAAVKAVVTAVVAAYKASAVVRAVVAVVMTIATSRIAAAFQKKPGKGENTHIDQGLELALKLNPAQPRAVPLGKTATGGSLVWAFTSDDELGDVPNERLTRIISLSDVPIHDLIEVRDGDKALEWTGDWNSGFAACTSYLDDAGGPCMFLQFFKGSEAGAPNPWLIERSGGLWTEQHVGAGQAYVVLTMIYRPNAFPNGEPGLVFVVEGPEVLDDRTESVGYSDNVAVLTAAVLRGFKINGQLILGAQAEERDFSLNNLIAAYNVCDQSADSATGTEPRYRAGMMAYADQTVADILNDLMGAMDGAVYDQGGVVSIQPGSTRTPTMDLTDEDIVWTDEKSWQPKADLASLYNSVAGSFVGGADGYIEKPLPPLVNTDWEEDDGGERFIKEITLKAVIYDSQAQRIASRVHKSSRFSGVVTFVAPLWCWELEQGDWFTLTTARWGMEEKLFEVIQCTLTPDFRIAIMGKEVHPNIDEWDGNDEIPDGSTPWTPGQYGLIIPVLEVQSYTVQNEDETISIPGLQVRVMNDPGRGTATDLDYQIGVQEGSDYTNIEDLPRRPVDQLGFSIQEGILPSTVYGVRSRSYDGVNYSPWSPWYYDTTGEFVVPPVPIDPEELTEILEDLVERGAALRDRVLDLFRQIWDTISFDTQPIFDLAFAHTENKAYQDALLYLGKQPVGSVVLEEQVRTNDLVYDRDLLGVRSEDGLTFELNLLNLVIDPITGETMGHRYNILTSQYQANAAAITAESLTRANQDSALATNIGTVSATVTNNFNTLQAGIVTEQTARANADLAEASLRELLAARVTTAEGDIVLAEAAITNEALTRATQDTAIAYTQTLLTARVGDAESAILTEQMVRATADSGFASTVNLIGVVIGGGAAFRLNTTTVEVTPGQSFGEFIEGVNAIYDDATAYVDQQWTVVGRPGYQQASFLQSIGIMVAGDPGIPGDYGLMGSVTELAEVINGPDGINSRWGIAVHATYGTVVGIVLNSGAAGDYFVVQAPFFGVSDGVSTIYPLSVSGGVVRATNFEADRVKANTIVADMIVGGAVTAIYTGFGGSASIGSTACTCSVVSTGAKHLVFVHLTIGNTENNWPEDNAGITITLYRNGSYVDQRSHLAPPSFSLSPTFVFEDDPGSGSFNYTIGTAYTPGSSPSAQVANSSIVSLELKK